MTRIAHLSDPHILEPNHHKRVGIDRHRLSYLSFGRPLDAQSRRRRFEACLNRALNNGVDHVLVTGDLTEDGAPAQFEVVADVLQSLRVDPSRITLVPGNHDIYHHPGAWNWAINGPLAEYAMTSREGAVTVLPDTIIKPIYTLFPQPFTRSAGAVKRDDILTIARLAHERIAKNRTIILAQHHPPTKYRTPILNWLDGLQDDGLMRTLLTHHPDLYVLHGHVHRNLTRCVGGRGHAQIFSTEAVANGRNLLRFYATDGSRLRVDDATTPTTQPTDMHNFNASIGRGFGIYPAAFSNTANA
jgi:3',5'-cyclic AMP phosphodiesterase CpdA